MAFPSNLNPYLTAWIRCQLIKVDRRHHSLSRFGAADFMASVDVDVERAVVETDEVAAEIVVVISLKRSLFGITCILSPLAN